MQKFNFHSIRIVLQAVAFVVTIGASVCFAHLAHADTKTQAFARSVELFSKGDYVKSRKILIALVKRDRKNSLYWFNLGNSLFMLGDHKRAIACYRQVEKLKSPLTPAARLYQAKAWSASGKADKSLELTTQVINDPKTPPSIRSEALKDQKLLISKSTASPSEALSLHEKALEQYRNGQFSELIESLDSKAIEQDEDLATLKAMALIKLSRRDEAYQILKRLSSTSANRERIEILNRLINEKKSETYIKSGAWFYLDPSIGYTTNASLKSQSENPDSSLLYRFTFGAGRKVVEFSETTSLLFSYAGQIDLIQSLPGNFSHSHQVQTYIDFGAKSWIIQLGPVFELEKIELEGDQFTLQRLGTRARARQLLQNHEWGAELTYFHQTNPSSEQSDLNGNLLYARLFYGLISFPYYGQIFLDVTQNNTAELTSESVPIPNAYQGTAPGLRLVWKHSGNWISSYQVRHETRRYSALTLAGQSARSDQESSLALRLAKLWKPTLSTYLTLGHNMNSSAISQLSQQSESYNATTLFLGLQWDLVK